ncbi:methyltransferase domain-containing protein [Streptomyces sp. NPDC087212]|uniref:class I SAM-dependent methyltransferase n=1 Tax=Streptomyces sp. NPDC087212 TaxID=3365766 RepID=UPI0038100112
MEHIADLGRRLLAHTHLDAVQGVLDVGCGPGAALVPAARAVGPNGQATGVDLSASLVTRARETIDRHGLAQARMVRGDTESTPEALTGVGHRSPDTGIAGIAGIAASLANPDTGGNRPARPDASPNGPGRHGVAPRSRDRHNAQAPGPRTHRDRDRPGDPGTEGNQPTQPHADPNNPGRHRISPRDRDRYRGEAPGRRTHRDLPVLVPPSPPGLPPAPPDSRPPPTWNCGPPTAD